MEVRGTITRVTYYNTTNGYSVLMIKLDEEDYKIKRTKSNTEMIEPKNVIPPLIDFKICI